MKHVSALLTLLLLCGPIWAGGESRPTALTPEELAEGWILLFDGESLFEILQVSLNLFGAFDFVAHLLELLVNRGPLFSELFDLVELVANKTETQAVQDGDCHDGKES